jgi:hypothetical protein
MNKQEYQELLKTVNKQATRTKYRNTPTTIDGITFDSRLEAEYYSHLKLLKAAGIVRYFLTQVSIRLSCGSRYVADFEVIYEDGRIEFVDTKGIETQVFKLKKRMVEREYPITLKIVKKGDF